MEEGYEEMNWKMVLKRAHRHGAHSGGYERGQLGLAQVVEAMMDSI